MPQSPDVRLVTETRQAEAISAALATLDIDASVMEALTALDLPTQEEVLTAINSAVSTASTTDRDRANHTGTQLAATISDFSDAVTAIVEPMIGSGGTGGGKTVAYVTVGSSELPSAARAACDFQCTGTNDQIEINAALKKASRANDAFGGEGYIGVALVGPRFYVGNSTVGDGAGAITMYPSTHLFGQGPGTIITPMWSTNVDRGAIELLNADVAHVRVSNLSIGRHNAVSSNGHGIRFVNNASADAYEVKTAGDPYIQIDHVFALLMNRTGFYVTGTSGGARETQISHCLAWSCGERGFFIDASDCQVSDCRATGGGNFPRFEIGGGNTKVANCKAYFSGNRVGDGSSADGFVLTSSRLSIVGCDAQDNGRWGFQFSGQDVTAGELVADSNSNKSTTGGGFNIDAKGMYAGLHAYNRPQTPTSPQQRAFVFSGSRQVFVTGRAGIGDTNAGAAHVSGTPAANSYVRIVRDGTTIYQFGGTVADHDHDDRYFTESEITTLFNDMNGVIAEKADLDDPRFTDARTPTAHDHDDRYFTETEADDLFFRKQGNNIVMNSPLTDGLGTILLNDDGSNDQDWPNRLMWRYKRLGGGYLETLTSFFNEYGEFRVCPAQGSTVPFRVFSRETSAHTEHNTGVPLIEVMTDRSTRDRKFAVHNDGSIESDGALTLAGGVTAGAPISVAITDGPTLTTGYLVLGAGDVIPANTPAGTLIFRTEA